MAGKDNICSECKFFRNPEQCPRIEWKPETKNRWGIHLNHVVCLPSDPACKKFQPKKNGRRQNSQRVYERLVEAIQ